MRERQFINRDWQFTKEYTEEWLNRDYTGEYTTVEVPHSVAETPFHYLDESIYEHVSGYRKLLYAPEEWKDKKVTVTFEGAAHYAEVYVNGTRVADHACGYTAFTVDLTPHLMFGEENILAVKLDSRETLNQPPFGNVIDYMTYGGIYREVYLDITEKTYIEDIFVRTKRIREGVYGISAEITCVMHENDTVQVTVTDAEHKPVTLLTKPWQVLTEVKEWTTENPYLYYLRAELLRDGEVVDACEERFGFREAVFKKDGFYLNGRKLKLRGLNRHQSYPYVGYAMPEAMQKRDADLIKEELGLNAVRTSHYPQSQHFVNRCDELGLLVFTEIPGWQHIGDEEWKQIAMKNTEEMVLQYRNHPSVILWGVRINESMDDDEFYKETNRIAHGLDDTRQTSGVRYIQKSHLLEDVYAYNDFSHSGNNAGCIKRKKVTPDRKKGYLISEYGGHMFPTKDFDTEEHVQEHMLRHARVINAYYGEKDIAGGFGWCMFDYNTHKDFGSGDRICYHGVMDMFRNKKLAGELYAAQQDSKPVLEISSAMDIGEHPAGILGDIYAVTNADSIRIYKNNVFVKEVETGQKKAQFANMPHGPVLLDDFIGDLMIKKEGFSRKKSEDIKKVLMAANRYGMANLPFSIKLLAVKCMIKYRMKLSDAVDLYGKYIGNWGGTSTTYRFEAVKDGEAVKVVEKSPMHEKQLTTDCSHTELHPVNTYDVAAVRFRMESESGNLLPFAQDILSLRTTGDIELIGPEHISLRGGMGGTYVRSKGESGTGKLLIFCEGMPEQSIEFTVGTAQP